MIDSNQLWLMHPPAFATFAAMGERAARGEPIAAAPSGHKVPTTDDSVAHLYMTGVLLPGDVPAYARGRATSMPELAEQARAAAADPSVKSIVLHVNSPGGTAQGTQALSDAIFSARASKPMHAEVDGMCASAALWSASATGKLLLTSHTDAVGSIGVLAHHVDVSGAHAAAGIKVTAVTSTPLKDAASGHRPLDDAGRAEMQRGVDHVHKLFTQQLARNLNASPAAIAKVADGRVFYGREAITAGLARGFINDGPSHGSVPTQQHDVAARAKVWAAQQEKLGRRVTAYEAVAYINSL